MTNDDTQPASASGQDQREQQQTPDPATDEQPARPQPAPDQPPATVPAYETAGPARNRGRLLLAGAAVAVGLVAGTLGFALGHATAGDDRDGPARFGGPRGPGGFPDGGPMGRQHHGPQGTFPGQPPDGFGDREGDDDQQLPDEGTGDGPASAS